MSIAVSHLLTNPLTLIAIACATISIAWQGALLARAQSASRKLRPREREISHDNDSSQREKTTRTRSRKESSSPTARALLDAGIAITPRDWRLLRIGAALVLFACCVAARTPMLGVLSALGVFAGSHAWLRARQSTKEIELENQVFQLEMQMAENSRAGLSVERSLKTCLEHADAPIKAHLERIVNELSFSNRTLTEAFASFAERTNSRDVAMLSSVIAVQQETGANLADTLDFLAESIEEKQRMRMTLRSRVAEMKLTKVMVAIAPIIIVLLCCLLIEGTIAFYSENPLGWVLIGASALAESLGLLILNKMSAMPID